MKKNVGIIAMIAVCLIVVGSAVAAGAYFLSGGTIGVVWESGRFRPMAQHGNTRGSEKVQSGNASFPTMDALRLEVDLSDVELIPVEDATEVRVEYNYLVRMGEPTCKVENGTLLFRSGNLSEKGFSLFNLNGFNSINEELYVRVYYPQGQVFTEVSVDSNLGSITCEGIKTSGLIKIGCDLGSIKVSNVVAARVEVINSAGESELSKVNADSLIYDGDLGEVQMDQIEVSDCQISCSSGEIVVQDSTIGRAELDGDLGSIKLRNVSSSRLDVDASSGEVQISGELRGQTEIDSDLGTVTVETSLPKSSYQVDLSVDLGTIRVDGERQSHGNYQQSGSNENSIQVECSSGDVEISFQQ